MTARRIGAAVTVTVVLGCVVPSIVIPIAHHSLLGLAPPDLGAAVALGAVGAFLLVRGAVTNIAVMMCVQGIGAALTVLCGVLVALAALPGRPLSTAAVWTGWFGDLIWLPGVTLLVPLVLLFPDGRLAHRYWRWPIRLTAALAAVYVGFTVVRQGPLEDDLPESLAANPTAFVRFGPTATRVVDIVANSIAPGCALLLLVSLGAVVARRRAAVRVERAQLTCLLFGAAVTAVMLVGLTVLPEDTWWDFVVALLVIVPIASSIAVAVLRYRLYDIDRLVSRTVAYVLVVALLAGVYVGTLAALAALVPVGYGQVGVAAATLAATIVAVPLTRRVRRVVDRRFNRSRFDAEGVVGAFAARLRAQPDHEQVAADLVGVLQRTVQPAHVSVWTVGR